MSIAFAAYRGLNDAMQITSLISAVIGLQGPVGSLRGYGAGLHVKEVLLRAEGAK